MPTLEKLKTRFPQAILNTHSFRGDDTVLIDKGSVREILRFLKTDPELEFNMLMDLSVVDYLHFLPAAESAPLKRFEVVYHLYSLSKKHRIRIKAAVDERNPELDSVTLLWPVADWLEREAWDMFGIRFDGHPNLKRILMYEEFSGHPLRKDYPVHKRQPLIGPKN